MCFERVKVWKSKCADIRNWPNNRFVQWNKMQSQNNTGALIWEA